MSAYKEKSIWKMNMLILYRSLPVLLAIIGLVVIFFPYTFLPDYLEGEIEDARSKCVNMIHGLLLLGSLLPCLVLLPAWVEENSRELLHAMAKNKAPCLIEIFWVFRFYVLIVLLPVISACSLLKLSFLEPVRMIVELLFVLSAYYLLMSLLQSALLGTMIMVLYLLFTIIVCRNTEMQIFCIVRPDLFYYDEFFLREGVGLLPTAVICGVSAFYIEKNKPGINI